MRNEQPRAERLRRKPTPSIKVAVATLFLTFLIMGFMPEGRSRAETLPQTSESTNPLPATDQNIALGMDHFTANCAGCHSETGKADTARAKAVRAADLTSQKTQSKSDAELFKIISGGVPGSAMPAFGKTHKPDEIWQTILFLRKLPTLTPDEKQRLEAAMPESAHHRHGAKEEAGQHSHAEPAKQDAVKPPADKQEPVAGHQHQPQQSQPQKTQQPATGAAPSRQAQPAAADPHAGHQMPAGQPQQTAPAGPVITLADVERMAAQNNPTLAQAEAAIRAAQGRRRQAGLWPNPIVGYMGEELSFRAPGRTSEHMFFVEQTIPLGGKLRKSKRVFEQEVVEAETEAFAQKQRVLNAVRVLYYEALGAQRMIDLRAELVRIAQEAVKTTSELYNVGQADRPDYFEAEIEAQEIMLDFEEAQNSLQQSWQLLAAVAGNPAMRPARLAGNLEEGLPALDQEALMATLLRDSPEIRRARAEVERARAVVSRAKAERIPNLFLRGGIGYNNELLDVDNRPVGKEAFIEAGINLPIFNRNQGGIAAAEAELAFAERDAQRVDLVLRTRFTQAFTQYRNSLRKVQRYQQVVLPRAERAYNLYLASFRQMSASYPQVLIAQRTMFQVREDYVRALVDVRANAIQIEGFLLTGGLNAPRLQPFEAEEGGENATPGFMHGRQGAGGGQDRDR